MSSLYSNFTFRPLMIFAIKGGRLFSTNLRIFGRIEIKRLANSWIDKPVDTKTNIPAFAFESASRSNFLFLICLSRVSPIHWFFPIRLSHSSSFASWGRYLSWIRTSIPLFRRMEGNFSRPKFRSMKKMKGSGRFRLEVVAFVSDSLFNQRKLDSIILGKLLNGFSLEIAFGDDFRGYSRSR